MLIHLDVEAVVVADADSDARAGERIASDRVERASVANVENGLQRRGEIATIL